MKPKINKSEVGIFVFVVNIQKGQFYGVLPTEEKKFFGGDWLTDICGLIQILEISFFTENTHKPLSLKERMFMEYYLNNKGPATLEFTCI